MLAGARMIAILGRVGISLRGPFLILSIVALVLGCGAPRTANDAIKVSLPNKHYFLANGLEVVLESDHHSPFVAIRVRYHVGSKDDPNGRSGMAHLVEHLTFARGAHMAKDDVLDSYSRLGAIERNGGTTLEYTDYYAVIPASQIESALWIEAERMAFVVPALDDFALKREIAVVSSERSEHYGNRVYGWLDPIVQDALFPAGHPYHRSTIGSAAELAGTTNDEVAAFLHHYYVPDDATLVLVGDLGVPRAAALVEKHFGSIPPGPQHAPPRMIPTPPGPARTLVHVEASVPYPLLALAWLGPPPGSTDYEDAKLALGYVAGAFNYRTTHLSKLVTGMWTEAYGGRLGSIFELVIMGDKGATRDALTGEAKRALWAVSNYSAAWMDISSSRSRSIGKVILGLEDSSDRTEHTADGLDYYGTPDYAQTQIDNLVALTAVGLQSAVDSTLAADRATYIWIEPNSGAPPAGRVIP